MKTYNVRDGRRIFQIIAEKADVADGVLMFRTNEGLVAAFASWQSFASADIGTSKTTEVSEEQGSDV